MAKKQIKEKSHKLVIAISSRALFNLDHSHKIFKEEGIEAYAKHQQENERAILEPGVGFTLVRKLLKLNSKKTTINKYHPMRYSCSDFVFQWKLNLFMLRWLEYCLDRYNGAKWQKNK